jgi:RNA polymerase sigma factor (sigma-70 family)
LEHSTADQERCAAMIAALNAELHWHLAADVQRSYMAALLQCGAQPPVDTDLRRLVITFHQEHALVEALRNRAHPQHEVVWGQWCTNALRILRSQGLGTPGDALSDIHDLAQVALEDLVRSLPTFRYASRLSTWAYTVISQSAQRYLRDLRAAKRSRPTESLSQPEALEVAAPATEQPDAHAEARVLNELIHTVLAGQPDPRWVTIFQLWMHHDQRLADIGKQIGVSGSRVSIQLDQIIEVLRQHPALLAWLNADLEGGQQRASRAAAQTNEPPI